MVLPVFCEASGTSARYHHHGTDRVEACRPRVMSDSASLAVRRCCAQAAGCACAQAMIALDSRIAVPSSVTSTGTTR